MRRYLRKGLLLLVSDPILAFSVIRALAKGTAFIIFYRVTSKRVRIAFPFFLYHRLRISGPGIVSIKGNCSVHANAFRGLSVTTLSEKARVWIGEGCQLGGTTIRCRDRVIIGDRTMSASCLIQDSWFTEVEKVKAKFNTESAVSSMPISIGRDVWLASSTVILRGSKLGDSSVVAHGSVTSDFKVRNDCLTSGNPAVKSLSIRYLEVAWPR